nr:triple geneblock protein 3 [Nerine potexvirus 1]
MEPNISDIARHNTAHTISTQPPPTPSPSRWPSFYQPPYTLALSIALTIIIITAAIAAAPKPEPCTIHLDGHSATIVNCHATRELAFVISEARIHLTGLIKRQSETSLRLTHDC